MATLEQWKERKKTLGFTNKVIADTANLPLRTVEQVMCGKVKNPRNDTVQAIERALGLAPTFTAEEQAQGAVNSLTRLSDRDLNTLGIINRAEDVLGFQFVDKHLELLDLYVEQKLKK